ncbi:MAG: glycosyltransferase family 39 protein [Acidobacteriota bacterium]
MSARVSSTRQCSVLLALFTLVVLIRVIAPDDQATGDQPLQLAYIRDILVHHAWIVQHGPDGEIASKPPLYNWLAALIVLVMGSQRVFFMKLPSIVSGLLTVGLVRDIGKRLDSSRVGTIAAVFFVLTPMLVKHVYFARTDMLLTLLVLCQFDAALYLENSSASRLRGTMVYWLAGALGMLTKGPIALLIPLAGLGAWYAWRGEFRQRWKRLALLPGIGLALLPFAIWFATATAVGGKAVVEQLLFTETIDRIVPGPMSFEFRSVFYYIPYLILRIAPWSILAMAALPSFMQERKHSGQRVHEMSFVVAWFTGGFAFLSIIPSKRVDRLFPLVPAVCLLAAWGIDRAMAGEHGRRPRAVLGTLYGWFALTAAAGASLIVFAGTGASSMRRVAPSLAPALAIAVGSIVMGTAITGLVAAKRRCLLPVLISLAAGILAAMTLYQMQLNDVQPQHGERAVLTPVPDRNLTRTIHMSEPGGLAPGRANWRSLSSAQNVVRIPAVALHPRRPFFTDTSLVTVTLNQSRESAPLVRLNINPATPAWPFRLAKKFPS